MSRPFNFRINAAELFTEIQALNMEQKAAFITQFSTDLLTLIGTSDYSKKVISETMQLIEKRSESGKLGGRPKSEDKAKVKQSISEGKAKVRLCLSNKEKEKENNKEKDCMQQTALFDSEKRIRECIETQSAFISEKYPLVNIAEETEEIVAKYRSTTIGADPWLLILRWIKNVKPKPGIDSRPGFIYGRDPKPEAGTPEYKLWREAHAAHCN